MPLTMPPLVKCERMKDLAGTPCGDDCFLLKSVGDDVCGLVIYSLHIFTVHRP
jgi:hypothetical protein